jgi:hypothetical protein
LLFRPRRGAGIDSGRQQQDRQPMNAELPPPVDQVAALCEQGRLEEAEAICRSVLHNAPRDAEAMCSEEFAGRIPPFGATTVRQAHNSTACHRIKDTHRL